MSFIDKIILDERESENIESAKLNALRGAEKTIRKYKTEACHFALITRQTI